ncbi:MAG: hypothetical protein GZ085_08485 [Sulfuriferula multivorans]|uniref:Uncharacterized protein n=1 Tax=Sulfuriferula multivorans TaxID=1559896 RepID=A0A7C9P5I0_9PROT|nr:hypothetical protein [Sulfuriferula multivorans]
MQLLELTPAELTFLNTAPAVTAPAVTEHTQQRLTHHLASVLTARLRLPVTLHEVLATDPARAQSTPVWFPDAVLASLWLTRRLGGKHVSGVAPFVPLTLIQTLNEVLAECWLDGRNPEAMPTALTWQLTADHMQARLAVQFPHHLSDMTNWARGVIKHV